MISRLRSLWLALVLVCAASPALADWKRAETAHFVVYSDGSERQLREYAVTLERFDALLRARFQQPANEDIRKLPVYLVADARALRVAIPTLPEGIDGYYSTSETDIFAVLIRGRSDDILMHEYVHHFMAQTGETRFPGWLSEGVADYFATAEVSARGKATFGVPNPGRSQALARERWLPMERVLGARGSFDLQTRQERDMFYNQSWLLTHWMFADPARVGRLGDYLAALSAGQEPVAAWLATFGQSPEQLATELKRYLGGRIYYAEMELPALSPAVEVTSLTAAADDVLLPLINARRYDATEADGAGLLQTFQAAAARHPDDPLALVALARAQQRWGDPAAAETALTAALQQGDNVEGLLLMADILRDRADQMDDPAARVAALRAANGFLRRAMEADGADYRVYAALARVRRNEPSYPSQNDLMTWELALQYAPQVTSIRGDAAIAFLEAGRFDEAAALLTPIMNDPHGGPGARQARDLMARIAERRGSAETSSVE